jgi:hypothetical protein
MSNKAQNVQLIYDRATRLSCQTAPLGQQAT